MNTNQQNSVNPFREMVVNIHPHLKRKDIIKMAYLLELSPKFEEELGSNRDPLLFFMQKASMDGKVTPENVDLLLDALLILNKPACVIEEVITFEEKRLLPTQASTTATTVWKKIAPCSDQPASGSSDETTYQRIMEGRYWLKFTEWCRRQGITEPDKAPCKKVVEYLDSLTTSIKLRAIMFYYRAILQYHQEFKPGEKARLEECISRIRNQEKKAKS